MYRYYNVFHSEHGIAYVSVMYQLLCHYGNVYNYGIYRTRTVTKSLLIPHIGGYGKTMKKHSPASLTRMVEQGECSKTVTKVLICYHKNYFTCRPI